jgi:hypothetical protein
MPVHLEPDWELEKPTNFWIHHFWDTIRVLGGNFSCKVETYINTPNNLFPFLYTPGLQLAGWKGLLVLTLVLGAFYGYVVYTIEAGRAKRERSQKRR